MRARVSLLACIAVSAIAMAVPASASAQTQEGLVNLQVNNNVVQVPVGIAANVCDVNVAVLVNTFLDSSDPCISTADGEAFVSSPPGGGQGGDQSGLVNVMINDNTVQIPLAVALNVCDINVVILTSAFADTSAPCDARGNSQARN